MLDFLDAFRAAFDAAAAGRDAFDGGLWFEKIPSEVDLEGKYYVVLHVIDAPTDPRAGGVNPYIAHVQLDAWGPVSRTVGQKLKALCDALDETLLDLGEGNDENYWMQRMDKPRPMSFDPDYKPSGRVYEDLSRWMVEYEYAMHP